jgi:hypothetical protein
MIFLFRTTTNKIRVYISGVDYYLEGKDNFIVGVNNSYISGVILS